jgi:hypothetical protein
VLIEYNFFDRVRGAMKPTSGLGLVMTEGVAKLGNIASDLDTVYANGDDRACADICASPPIARTPEGAAEGKL